MLLSRVFKEGILETLNLEESVIVHLGNGKACKVQGMGLVRL